MTKRIIQKVDSLLYDVSNWVCIASLAVMLLITMQVVIGRYCFSYTPAWSEELSLFLMTWVGLFSASISEHNKEHIRISYIDRIYPRVLLRIFGVIRYFLKIGFFAGTAYYGCLLFRETKQTYAAMALSYKWEYLPGICMGIVCLVFSLFKFKKEMTDKYDHISLEEFPHE